MNNGVDVNNADSLLEELKSLNKSLKQELVKEKETDPETVTVAGEDENDTVDPTEPENPLTEDTLGAFILETSQKIIKSGLETIDYLKETVANTEDSRTMSGFAEIVSATNNVINTLNAINIEKRKAATAKEIKTMDIEAKKQLQQPKTVNNTLNLTAPREEIIKMLEDIEEKRVVTTSKKASAPVTINVDAVETPVEPS